MTIDEVKAVIGEDVGGAVDEQMEKNIEAAEFLKDIFFDFLRKGEIKSGGAANKRG